MDLITTAALSTVIAPLASGVAGEAGKQAWTSLTTFVKARLGRDSAPAAAIDRVERSPEPHHADVLAGHLHRLTSEDPQAAQWLATWLDGATTLVHQHTDASNAFNGTAEVSNTIGGQAQVHGPVLQGHTFSGPISFGPPS